MSLRLAVTPLTPAAFAPFGEVIEATGDSFISINEGMARRFNDLARLDVADGGGHAILSVFRARPWFRPIGLRVMERHPLGSQAFIPMHQHPFLIVVAPPGEKPAPDDLKAFITNGRQGCNYARGVWHHPLLALDHVGDFLVADRAGPGHNLDEIDYTSHQVELDC